MAAGGWTFSSPRDDCMSAATGLGTSLHRFQLSVDCTERADTGRPLGSNPAKLPRTPFRTNVRVADNPRIDRTDLRRLQRTHPYRRIGLSNTFAQTISEPECFRLSRRSECANQHGCLFDAGVLQAFDKLFTPSLTLRKLRSRFFNYKVWQCVPGGAPLSYASQIYCHSVI
jgi:hypothetical protein